MLASDGADDSINSLSFSHARDIVELVILTADEAFLQTLRDAVGGSRRLWPVTAPDKVGDLLVAGDIGILVLDTQCVPSAAGTFLSQIKRQFPDLVLVVAGNRDDEASLAGLISSGLIYRFIHKPMSPGRAKHFADAAVRKYVEQRARVPAAVKVRRPLPAAGRLAVGAALGALVLVIAGTALWTRRPKRSPDAPPPPVAVNIPAQGGPPAASFQSRTAEARDGYLAAAEAALLEERLGDAASALEAARKAGGDPERLAFLSAQLAKSRERARRAQSRQKADSHVAATSAPDELQTRALSLAAERMQSGRLIEPEGDSARFYVEQALRMDPNTNAAQAARQSLALALLTEAHGAIDRHDFVHASAVLDAAAGIAAPTNVDSLREQMANARSRAETEAAARPQPDRPPEPANALASAAAGGSSPGPAPAVVHANSLTLIKSVDPVYPKKAELDRIEGWVELEFTVTATGSVRDIAVHAANPAGVFNEAAVRALAQWRYKPPQSGAGPTTQRTRIRIRFALGG